jgi:hypothetical protein
MSVVRYYVIMESRIHLNHVSKTVHSHYNVNINKDAIEPLYIDKHTLLIADTAYSIYHYVESDQ